MSTNIYTAPKVCFECHRVGDEFDIENARMTRGGVLCERCAESRDLGWVSAMPKLFRSRTDANAGAAWRKWFGGTPAGSRL